MKAGIYIRVSTLQQEDGTSLATQEEGCRLAAREEGYEVSSDCVWSDQWSGADIERPGLGQMRMAVKKGAVSAVFVFTPDRLARDPFHLLLLGQEFRDVGVRLRFVRGPSDDSPEGRLLMYIQGYVGQQERALIAERTMRGKRAVAESGRLPNGTGAGLFGYDYDPLFKLRTINEREATAVRLMFRWAAAGVSRYQIARRLNKANIPTKKGKLWYPLTVHRTLCQGRRQNIPLWRRESVPPG